MAGYGPLRRDWPRRASDSHGAISRGPVPLAASPPRARAVPRVVTNLVLIAGLVPVAGLVMLLVPVELAGVREHASVVREHAGPFGVLGSTGPPADHAEARRRGTARAAGPRRVQCPAAGAPGHLR